MGALVLEYDTKPSWWPTGTQSQTITFGAADGTASGNVGETLTAATTAAGHTVSYLVTDPGIAKVNANGQLQLLKAGTTEVLAYVPGDKSYDAAVKTVSLTVKVAPPVVHVTGVTLNKSAYTLRTGDSTKLAATVAPVGATDSTLKWSSSNAKVATVDTTGRVKAIAEGSANITATTTDGGFTASCAINVVDYSYLKAATIAVENDTMRVAGPGAGAYTKLYINGTASPKGDLSQSTGTLNLKATDANATKLLKLTITRQASASASAKNNAAERAAAERSLRDAVNNSFVNPKKP